MIGTAQPWVPVVHERIQTMPPKTPAEPAKGPMAETAKQVVSQARHLEQSAQNINASAGAAVDSADQQLLSS